MTQLLSMLVIVKKDLAVFLRNPIRIVVTIAPAMVLILVLVLQGDAVAGTPVAIVNRDPLGVAAHTLQQDAVRYDGFLSVVVMPPQQAQAEYERLQVAAILTIPTHFSADLRAGRKPSLTWQVRNFNDNVGDDLRRALPDIVKAFIVQGGAGSNPIRIRINETDLHAQDAGFLAYQLVSVLVVFLLQASLVSAGLAVVSEWESGSIKELLVSPANHFTVILAKVLGGVIISDLVGFIAIGSAWVLGLMPRITIGEGFLSLIVTTILAAFGSGVGVALGSVFRNTEKTALSSILISFYLFFLSGGIAAFAYLPPGIQAIARWIPSTYAVRALQSTLLYGSVTDLWKNVVVLSVAAVVGLFVGIPAMRRGISH